MEEKKVNKEETEAKENAKVENKESNSKEKDITENKELNAKEKGTTEKKETNAKEKVTTENKVVNGKVTIEDNRNKKNIMLAYTIVGVVFIIVLATVLYVSSYIKTPYYAVRRSFASIKKGDIASVNRIMSYDELMNSLLEKTASREKMSNLDKSCFEKFEYNIEDTKTDGDTATVTISTTNKNFRNALTKWSQSIYQKFISGEEISNDEGEKVLIECLSDDSIGTMSVTEEITLNKIDGKWHIQVDDKLQRALFPGLSEVADSVDSIVND